MGGSAPARTTKAVAPARAKPKLAAAKPVVWPEVTAPRHQPGPRVYSKVRFLWIRPKPTSSVQWIAYLSLGESVRLRGGKLATAEAGKTSDCPRWLAVEPRGYVCADPAETSLDAQDSDVVAMRKGMAKWQPWPYAYGESTGTAVYLNVPPKRRQYFRESAFREHMANVKAARKATTRSQVAAIDPQLVGVDLKPTGNPPPPFLLHLGPRSRPHKTGGKYGFPEVARGSTVAYVYSFDAKDRSWILTWDRGVIPKDRIKRFTRSTFAGAAIGGAMTLPIAFLRRKSARLTTSGAAAGSWPRYERVPVQSETVQHGGKTYWRTRDGNHLLAAADVSVPRHRAKPPKMVDATRTWIDISITEGWLVAYEGPKPVYATMISPGRGGLPETGKTLLETASTPVGDYTIMGKFHTATMTSNYSDKVVHSEVPYTQNFRGPYALHAAYWHDDWGVGKSGGCVNLAPIDAMRMFAWTEPRLPPGWHGMRAVASDGAAYARATVVSLHR